MLYFLVCLIASFFVNLNAAPVPAGGSGASATVDWLIPIDAQLQALRAQDIERAYHNTTAKDFQEATSLENFTKFVSRYPILFSHESIIIKSQSIKNNEADVIIILDPEKSAVPVRYLLVLEEGKWKIWNMNVTPPYSQAILVLLKDPLTVRKTVEGQLQALHDDDVSKAYTAYFSKQFKKKTSEAVFEQFIKTFPILTQYDAVAFKEPTIDEGTGKVAVDLYSKSGTTTLEYTLGIEEEQWKIWGVQVLGQSAIGAFTPSQDTVNLAPPSAADASHAKEPNAPQQMQFTKLDVGNSVDEQGTVIDPSPILKVLQDPIYVNLYIKNGVAGTKVELKLKYLESQTSIPPISTTLQQDGSSVVSVAFSAPPQGWPIGRYSIEVSSSTGVTRQFSITTERQ